MSLTESRSEKAFGAFFRQDAYGERLERQIQEGIEEKVGQFKELVEFCLHVRAKNIETGVAKIGGGVSTIGNRVERIETLVNTLEGLMKAVDCM